MGTYRFASKNVLLASIGSQGVMPHGLGQTPDEYFLVPHSATTPYLIAASVPDASNIYVTSGAAGTARVSVFVAVNHTIIS